MPESSNLTYQPIAYPAGRLQILDTLQVNSAEDQEAMTELKLKNNNVRHLAYILCFLHSFLAWLV
jgi:hypothetical protein